MMLTVVSNPVKGGNVAAEPASTSGAYYPYDNVTLTAAAKSGYVFVNWTGDVAHIEDATQETIIVAMDKYYGDNVKDIQITANFERTGRFPWPWLAGGIVALLLTALAVSMLVLRRKRRQPDIPPQ